MSEPKISIVIPMYNAEKFIRQCLISVLASKFKDYVDEKYFWLPLGKFYRRDFLLENKIDFPQMSFSEDMVFCFKCLCLAKNYLRIPHLTNIRRELKNSTAKMIIDSQDGVRLWLKILSANVLILDEFMSRLNFFQINPDCRYEVLKFCTDVHFNMIRNLFQGLEPHDVWKIFYDELQNPELDSKGKNLAAAYLYAARALTR